MGIKLMPIILKPKVPISITLAFEVNTPSNCFGMPTKHKVPTAISTSPNITATLNVFLQRSMSLVA